ncbi:hypothetical protein [Micromonospora sp. NPDC048842]|uniref:hypothetical protein n=1 Tax=unclassified Micromonospora TaxID=2617518 RepID=UPI0033D7AE35
MELQLRMSDKVRDFVEQIPHEMLVRFPIIRNEAVGRVNQACAHHHGDQLLTPPGGPAVRCSVELSYLRHSSCRHRD